MRNAFIDAIIAECGRREDLFIISGDAGLGVFDDFRKKYPGRFLNLGVAEQNAVGFSAGLSLAGYKVYLYNLVPFVLYRCYEQVRNDICYDELPVTLVGIGSGVTYAPQGMTHYSVEDIGIARTLPNLTVLSPIDPVEARAAAHYSLGARGPVYVRLAKKGERAIHRDEDFDIARPYQLEDGEDIAIVFHGSIGEEVVDARKILEKEGIHPKLISLAMLQPMNFKELDLLLKDIKYAVSVEEHFIDTGLGGILAREYVKSNPRWKLFSLGIPNKFIHEIKDAKGMRDHFGISAKTIAEFIKGISLNNAK